MLGRDWMSERGQTQRRRGRGKGRDGPHDVGAGEDEFDGAAVDLDAREEGGIWEGEGSQEERRGEWGEGTNSGGGV